MSNNLNFGGAEAILVRDTGIANAVQGFVTKEITQGANVVGLPTTIFFTLDKRVVTPQTLASTIYDLFLTLSLETSITNSTNVEMNSTLSLISDNSLGEVGNLDLASQLNLTSVKDINLTTEMILELTHVLATNKIISTQVALDIISTVSLSTNNQINTSAFLDILSSINLGINLDNAFQMILEQVSEIILSGQMLMVVDVVRIVQEILNLNLTSEIIFEISSIFENGIELNVNTSIDFDSNLTIPIEASLDLNVILSLFSDSSYGLLRLINFLHIKNFHKIIG
jgi:hypothetical protein